MSQSSTEHLLQLVLFGVARVTSVLRSGRQATICIAVDDAAKQLQKNIDHHALLVDHLVDGQSIDMAEFELVRRRLRGAGNDELRINASLREIHVRHLLPKEEPDVEVERRELASAFDEWMKARIEYHRVAAKGEVVDTTHPARVRLRAAFERYDFARQRIENIMVGLEPQDTYQPRNTNRESST
jgi:hypothetical protein